MTIRTEVIIDGAQDLKDALGRLRQKIPVGALTMGRRLTEESQRTVERLTPRQANPHGRREGSKRGFRPFYQQWDHRENIQQRNRYESVVFNMAAQAGFSSAGHRALGALEWGARPHTIRATRPHGRLAWNERGTQARTGTLGGILGITGSVRAQARSRTRTGSILQHIQDRAGRGDVIVRGSVEHPGHGGFYFVRDTRRHVEDLAGRMLTEFSEEIGRIFMQPGSIRIS